MTDKASGDNYYWNSRTDEVTWEKPEELRRKRTVTNSMDGVSGLGATPCPRPAAPAAPPVPPSVPARTFPAGTPADTPRPPQRLDESTLRSAPAVPARTFGADSNNENENGNDGNDDSGASSEEGGSGFPALPSRSGTLRNSTASARPAAQSPSSATLGRAMPSRPPAGRPKFPTNAFGTLGSRPRANTPLVSPGRAAPALPERGAPAVPGRAAPAVPARAAPAVPERTAPAVPERGVPDVPADVQDDGGEYHAAQHALHHNARFAPVRSLAFGHCCLVFSSFLSCSFICLFSHTHPHTHIHTHFLTHISSQPFLHTLFPMCVAPHVPRRLSHRDIGDLQKNGLPWDWVEVTDPATGATSYRSDHANCTQPQKPDRPAVSPPPHTLHLL